MLHHCYVKMTYQSKSAIKGEDDSTHIHSSNLANIRQIALGVVQDYSEFTDTYRDLLVCCTIMAASYVCIIMGRLFCNEV